MKWLVEYKLDFCLTLFYDIKTKRWIRELDSDPSGSRYLPGDKVRLLFRKHESHVDKQLVEVSDEWGE